MPTYCPLPLLEFMLYMVDVPVFPLAAALKPNLSSPGPQRSDSFRTPSLIEEVGRERTQCVFAWVFCMVERETQEQL